MKFNSIRFCKTLVFLSACLHLQAQDLPNVIPPSPTASSMMNFEELPIDYYTGQPDIRIPIFSKKLHKDLDFNLALRYSTQELIVNSRSSWVGTGWSLEVGGAISRTVRGYVDEDPDWTSYGVLHNQDYWNYRSLDLASKNEFNWNVLGSRARRWDSELDLYQFNFMGHSGRFVIVKDGGSLKAKLLSIEKHYKIDLSFDPTSLKVFSFTIIDTKGYRYTFDQVETSMAEMKSGGIDQNPENPGDVSSGSTDTWTYHSAWYLTSVKTSHGKEILSIAYEHMNYSYENAKSIVDNEIIDWDGQSPIPHEALKNSYNNTILKPRYAYSWSGVTAQSWYPKTFKFRDSTSISMQISSEDHPEQSGNILASISLKDNLGQNYKQFSFEYSTINERLWLDGIKEEAGEINHSYKINYQSRSTLSVFEGEQDEWGYDPDYNSGVIQEIIYPTGGKREFHFEPHTYSFIGSQVVGDFSGNSNNETDDNYTFYFPNEVIDTESSAGLLKEIDLTFTHEHSASVYVNVQAETDSNAGIEGNNGESGLMDASWLKLLDQNNTEVASVQLNQTHSDIQIPAGSFRLIIETPQRATYTINGIVSLRYKKLHTSTSPEFQQYYVGGGLRIKQIDLFDRQFDSTPEKSVIYSYVDRNNSSLSSGTIDALGSQFNIYELDTKKMLFSDASNTPGAFLPRVVRYKITKEGMNVGLSRGGYVTYGRVVEKMEGNGKSEFIYTSAKTDPSHVDSHMYPFPPAPTIDFKRGLLLSKTIYDQANRVLRRETNNYVPVTEKIAPWIKVVDQEMCEWKQFYDSYSQYSSSNFDLSLLPTFNSGGIGSGNCGNFPSVYIYGYANDNYDLEAGWARQNSRIVDNYNYHDGQQIKTTTTETYDYNLENHQVNEVIATWKENGNTVSSKMMTYYPVGLPEADFQSDIGDLRTLNIIDLPLRVENFRNNELLFTSQNEYQFFNSPVNYQLELKRVWMSRGSFPLEPRIEFHSYDEFGNILEMSMAGDANHTTFLWSFGNSHPVAKIENITYSELTNIIDVNLLAESFDESFISGELDKLRNASSLQKSFIHTFSYTPEYWVKRQSDPSNLKVNYGYDPIGRLSEIVDHNGHLLNRYEYRYKRQNR